MSLYSLESAYSPELSVFVEDVVAPAQITNLIILPSPLGNKIVINWTNPTTVDFIGIEVHRSTVAAPVTPMPGTKIADGLIVSLNDTSVVAGTTYFYSVFTKDDEGNYSNAVSGQATPSVVFAPPTINPLIPQIGGLYVEWSDVPYVEGYRVYYGTSPDPSSYAAPVDVPVSSLPDPLSPSLFISGLDDGITYYVEVSAYYEDQETGQNEESIVIGLLPPSNVDGYYDDSTGKIVLSWDKSDSLTITQYAVYYKVNPVDLVYVGIGLTRNGIAANSPFVVDVASIDPDNPQIELDDSVLDTAYWFKVVAYDSQNNSSAPAHGRSNVTPHAGASSLPAPRHPTATIVQSNKQVTLFWDEVAL